MAQGEPIQGNKSRCLVPLIRPECKRWLCNVVVDFLESNNTCVPDLLPNDGHAQVEEDDAVASGAQHFHKVPKNCNMPKPF